MTFNSIWTKLSYICMWKTVTGIGLLILCYYLIFVIIKDKYTARPFNKKQKLSEQKMAHNYENYTKNFKIQTMQQNNNVYFIKSPSNNSSEQGQDLGSLKSNSVNSTTPNLNTLHLEDLRQIIIHSCRKNASLYTKIEPEITHNVPQVLHFIWIGSNISDKYIEHIKGYKQINQQYEIYLWVDNNTSLQNDKLKSLQIHIQDVRKTNLINREIYHMETNYGAKSDILRYEVVFKYGGIYTDIDSVAVKPFDQNFRTSFVTYSLGYKNLSNAIFGFPQNSSFLYFVLKSLPTHYKVTRKHWPPSKTGPGYFTTCFVAYNDNIVNLISTKFVLRKTSDSYAYHLNDANWLKRREKRKKDQ